MKWLWCWLFGHDWAQLSWRFMRCTRCKCEVVLFTWRRSDSWIVYHDGVVIDDDGLARRAHWDEDHMRLELEYVMPRSPNAPCVFCWRTDDLARFLDDQVCAPCWNSGKRREEL